ncbi:Hypothetical predicted protein [Cloeon dipterum]|uniref:Uncharacterized protein n=1 Tax=Cloeon dipterum TaxID=197152 RepID=A0A8S1DQ87_9INSE|nr:Hypothetical predicted protein [Cloeon dipterum]
MALFLDLLRQLRSKMESRKQARELKKKRPPSRLEGHIVQVARQAPFLKRAAVKQPLCSCTNAFELEAQRSHRLS